LVNFIGLERRSKINKPIHKLPDEGYGVFDYWSIIKEEDFWRKDGIAKKKKEISYNPSINDKDVSTPLIGTVQKGRFLSEEVMRRSKTGAVNPLHLS